MVLNRNKDGKLYVCLQDEEGQRRAVWERNMQMIEQHNREHSQGKHSFMMAMNGFGDMVSVAQIAEHFRLPLSAFPNHLMLANTLFPFP